MSKFKSVGDRLRIVGLIASIAACTASTSMAAEPSMRGKLLFLRCASCHDISDKASPKIGPNLLGVVGRKAGSLPGYTYSAAMKSQTFVWDEAHLNLWLTKPTDVVPGTAMAFGGMPSQADRDAVIAYLASQGR